MSACAESTPFAPTAKCLEKGTHELGQRRESKEALKFPLVEATIPSGSLGDKVQPTLIFHLAAIPGSFCPGSYHKCDWIAQ